MALYTPPRFVEQDREMIAEIIASSPFATLVSVADAVPVISHVPFVADERGWLLGHVAKANSHAALLQQTAEVLAIFHGPHAYVSPTWYREASVPTWNYAVVHVQAKIHSIDAADELLDALIATFESQARVGDTPHLTRAQRARLLNQIHCFALEPLKIDAKFKLSQNKSIEDRQRVITQLGQQENDNSQALAGLMLKSLFRTAT